MTITFTFKPEIEAQLLAGAESQGMALQDYLQSIVEREASPLGSKTNTPDVERRNAAVRRMVEFGEKYRLSLGEPVTRDLLHEGHRV